MSSLQEQICRILRRRFNCVCGSRPPYCRAVYELFNLVLEKCNDEHQEPGQMGQANLSKTSLYP